MKTEFKFPIFMLQFEKPVEYMYAVGKKYKKFFQMLGNLSVIVGVLGMILTGVLLTKGAWTIIQGGPAQVGLVIPGVRIPGSPIFIPLVEGLIAILLLAVFHEGMHGIVAASEGIRSKYTALILFLFIPAAGVEIDERKLAKKDSLSKLRIFSAGSMGNFILAILALGLMFPTGWMAGKFIAGDGLLVLNSSNLAFEQGAVITHINGKETKTVLQLRDVLGSEIPGAPVEVKTTNSTVYGTLTDEGKLGVYLESVFHYVSPLGNLFGFIGRILAISFTLNIGVGLINLLPLGILDGGRMMEELSPRWYKPMSSIALFLLLMNLIGPYLF
ncbi:MAG: hypothetical protein GOV01_01500 [Candidatus Altiarchaeota archaeon]|nr:hypothetical protein [Candidatus Altiarchaeota archaeon]